LKAQASSRPFGEALKARLEDYFLILSEEPIQIAKLAKLANEGIPDDLPGILIIIIPRFEVTLLEVADWLPPYLPIQMA
jgi:hypothetical protein